MSDVTIFSLITLNVRLELVSNSSRLVVHRHGEKQAALLQESTKFSINLHKDPCKILGKGYIKNRRFEQYGRHFFFKMAAKNYEFRKYLYSDR